MDLFLLKELFKGYFPKLPFIFEDILAKFTFESILYEETQIKLFRDFHLPNFYSVTSIFQSFYEYKMLHISQMLSDKSH